MASNDVSITITLTGDQAMALAQMTKRFSFETASQLANAFDGGRERDHMLDAVISLDGALREAGFAPR